MRWVAWLLVSLCAGCVAEPDYTGRACNAQAPCPSGWWCTAADTCAAGLDPGDAGEVSVDAGDAGPVAPDTGVIDTGVPDSGPPDSGPADTGPADSGVVLTAVGVRPEALMLAAGESASLTAEARWSDGSLGDVTEEVTWRVRDGAVARVEAGGLLVSLSPGTTVIEAELDGVVGTAALAVTAAEVVEAHTWNKHNLVVLTDGTVWGWGWNASGQVDESADEFVTAPRQLPITDVASVRAGGVHSVAIRRDGAVWAWGNDSGGQLGRGTITGDHQALPQPVLPVTGAGDLRDVADVQCGYDFCLALTTQGRVLAWGANSYGSLGMGDASPRARPEAVPGLSGIQAIAAGTYHALALRGDGAVLSWGYNEYGQLGRGQPPTSIDQPGVIPGVGAVVVELDAGWGHSVLRTIDDEVLTLGWAAFGQLGRDTMGLDDLAPAPADVQGALHISAGFAFTLVVTAGGVVQAFGSNLAGQLGDGTVGGTRLAPGPVLAAPGGAPFTTPTGWRAGGDHVLAYSRTQVWTFGSNQSGELGNGTAGDGLASGVPTTVTW